MTIKERYAAIVGFFKENKGHAESELVFNSPYQLLVSTLLSAQCTDKRVNATTPALFEAYPGPEELAQAKQEDVFELIRSISYPNNKSKHLVAMAKMLVEDFGGKVPEEIDELMKLPGVGRKTANVVASISWGEPVIAVDTHVFRVARRLGLSRGKTPFDVEKDLERHIEASDRPVAHHWLLLHGRYVCTAKNPSCTDCPLKDWCKTGSGK